MAARQKAFQARLMQLVKQQDNMTCADCRMPAPTWASKNIGVFICMSCAGIHRSLGVHISEVRSIALDSWEEPWVEVMQNGGNAKLNSYYEARMQPADRIQPAASDRVREDFIRRKYEAKSWFGQPGNAAQPNQQPLTPFERRALRRAAAAQQSPGPAGPAVAAAAAAAPFAPIGAKPSSSPSPSPASGFAAGVRPAGVPSPSVPAPAPVVRRDYERSQLRASPWVPVEDHPAPTPSPPIPTPTPTPTPAPIPGPTPIAIPASSGGLFDGMELSPAAPAAAGAAASSIAVAALSGAAAATKPTVPVASHYPEVSLLDFTAPPVHSPPPVSPSKEAMIDFLAELEADPPSVPQSQPRPQPQPQPPQLPHSQSLPSWEASEFSFPVSSFPISSPPPPSAVYRPAEFSAPIASVSPTPAVPAPASYFPSPESSSFEFISAPAPAPAPTASQAIVGSSSFEFISPASQASGSAGHSHDPFEGLDVGGGGEAGALPSRGAFGLGDDGVSSADDGSAFGFMNPASSADLGGADGSAFAFVQY